MGVVSTLGGAAVLLCSKTGGGNAEKCFRAASALLATMLKAG